MSTQVPIQDVLFTVFQSIIEVFILCLVGFTLSFKGIVDQSVSKVLNRINIAVFTPALLFSKVAFFLTPAKLLQLWVIPIFFAVVTGLSAVVAYWLARAFHLKQSQVNFVVAASMFMNSNSLPVALMHSLVTTVPLLKWGPDDTIDAMFDRSLTYLVVFSTLGMMLRWSYGVRLISQADESQSDTPKPTTYRDDYHTDGHPAFTRITLDPPTLVDVKSENETDTNPHDQMPWHIHSHLSLTPFYRTYAHRHTHPHSHLPAVPTSPGDQSESDDSDEVQTTGCDSEVTIAPRSAPIDTDFPTAADDLIPQPSPSSGHNVLPTPRWECQTRSSLLLTRLLTTLTSLSPPLVASLLSLFCVLIPPVQRFLNSGTMLPLRGALNNAGDCSIPLTLVVLGGWFWDGETKQKAKNKHTAKGEIGDNGKNKGKGVGEPQHGTGTSDLDHSHTSNTESALSGLRRNGTSPSHDSSSTSLSAMIETLDDVSLTPSYPRGGSGRSRLHIWGNVRADKSDAEAGSLATHAETGTEDPERGLGHSSPPRPRTNPVHPSMLSHVPGTNPPGETMTVFVTLLARMIIVPLIVTPAMVLVSRLGWGGEIFEDPVFIVSNMLLMTSPPALTLAQISQRAKKAKAGAGGADTDVDADTLTPFERLLTRTVFWAYCVLTPPVTIVSVLVGLLLVGP